MSVNVTAGEVERVFPATTAVIEKSLEAAKAPTSYGGADVTDLERDVLIRQAPGLVMLEAQTRKGLNPAVQIPSPDVAQKVADLIVDDALARHHLRPRDGVLQTTEKASATLSGPGPINEDARGIAAGVNNGEAAFDDAINKEAMQSIVDRAPATAGMVDTTLHGRRWATEGTVALNELITVLGRYPTNATANDWLAKARAARSTLTAALQPKR